MFKDFCCCVQRYSKLRIGQSSLVDHDSKLLKYNNKGLFQIVQINYFWYQKISVVLYKCMYFYYTIDL
jgi:hypothetical protein